MLLLSDGGLTSTVATARTSGAIFQPWQLWWFLGEHGHRVVGLYSEHGGYRTPAPWITRISHPLVVVVPVAVALLVGRRRRVLVPAEGLALLALALQLRGLLDTWNTVYYALPGVPGAGGVGGPRPPHSAGGAGDHDTDAGSPSSCCPTSVSPDLQAAFYLAWSVPLVCGLGLVLLRPAGGRAYAMTWSSLGSEETTSAPSSVTMTRSSMRTPTAPGT